MSEETLLFRFSLQELGLVDAPSNPSFDNLTRLAATVLGAPVSLVSTVDFPRNRQFFTSQIGLDEPWATSRQTPLSHSFCQHVVRGGRELVVDDAREHPLVRDNLAIRDLGVIAYLGVPIDRPEGCPVGALCVIDGKTRHWTEQDLAFLKQLSRCVSDAIRLTAALKTSEHLRAEQQSFTQAVSADLKAPLNAMSYLLGELDDAVQGKARDEDPATLIVDCRQVTDRMTALVADAIRYSRVVAQRAAREPIDLQELIETVRGNLSTEIDETGARVEAVALPVIRGSEDQLRLMMESLIGNAIKFRRPDAAPRVCISAHEQADEGMVEIRVEDNGIGIPQEHHDRVFKLFERLHLRQDYAGTGLGLTLCKWVVQNHGGEIAVSSDGGSGAQFVIRLPSGR